MKRACGTGRKRRAARLQTRESLKLGTAQSQLYQGTLRDQPALAHNQHFIESIEQAQPVHGGDQARGREVLEQVRVEARLGGGIQARGWLIEQHERTALRGENAPCKSNTAALSTGPIGRPLSNGSLETQRCGLYKVGSTGEL